MKTDKLRASRPVLRQEFGILKAKKSGSEEPPRATMKKSLCSVPTDPHSLLVERDEFVVSFRKCVLESLDNGLDLYDREMFEKCAESDHVHDLSIFQLVCSDLDCRNCNDGDVGAGRVLFDRGAFPDKNAAGFYFRLEF